MKILLTNDDGYQAPNIQHLFKKLSEEHDVWIIAPENNCSGMSAAISFLKETEIRKVEERVYAVDGTPADCTYFGLLGIVDFEFDIVISGINHGANIGNDVIYSGTVGAAVGGRNLKYPPIAISVASYDAKDIDFISKKSIEIINKIVTFYDSFKGKVININFPDISENEFKGIRATGMSKRDVPAKPIKLENTSENEINQIFINAEKNEFKGIIQTVSAPLVSNDFNHNSHSSVVDLAETNVINNRFCRILSWYDNEWGFSNRLVDIVLELSNENL